MAYKIYYLALIWILISPQHKLHGDRSGQDSFDPHLKDLYSAVGSKWNFKSLHISNFWLQSCHHCGKLANQAAPGMPSKMENPGGTPEAASATYDITGSDSWPDVNKPPAVYQK